MANINDIRGIGNPQRAYEFEVEVVGNHGLPILVQRVQSVSIPEVSVEQMEINFKSSKSMFAGRDTSPHTVTVSFFDTEDHATYNFFREWMNTIRDRQVGGGDTRDLYESTLIVKQLAHDSTTVTATNRFTKVWPQSVGEIQLSYESSEHLKFDVTFSYDEDVPS